MKCKKSKKGFTLVEMIASVAIFSVIIVVMVSIFTSSLRFNSMNKRTFDANSNSRAFYEAIREDRPYAGREYPSDGTYVLYFNDQNELKNKISTDFIAGATSVSYTTFSDVKADTRATTNKYAILINIKKNTLILPAGGDGAKYYELETKSWDLNKGEYTEIVRKSMITTK